MDDALDKMRGRSNVAGRMAAGQQNEQQDAKRVNVRRGRNFAAGQLFRRCVLGC